MNFAGVMRRKWVALPVVAALVVAAAGFVVLTNLNNPASGRLRHDGSLRTSTVEKQWQVKRERYDTCFVITYTGDISGNARSTWGITGPATVWENLRVHDTTVSVEARRLRSDGRCDGSVRLRHLRLSQQWKSDGTDWRGVRRNMSSFGPGSQASTNVQGAVVRLAGGSYDRNESYRATVGVYAEPTWHRRNGESDTLSLNVNGAVELPAS